VTRPSRSTGGGNSGATYTNDFVELRNLGSTPVDVTGWSVQYGSASGSTWQATALSGTVAPGGFFLVQEFQGAGGTTPLPTPDATGGKVALVTSTSALTCGTTRPRRPGCATSSATARRTTSRPPRHRRCPTPPRPPGPARRTPAPDADPATSEGLFVYTGPANDGVVTAARRWRS